MDKSLNYQSMFRRNLLLVLLFTSSINNYSQAQMSKNINPVTPNIAALLKVQETPVNMHSGAVAISIPIYTISFGDVDIPINMSYQNNGIRVDETASWVGLGWHLSMPGVITKIVRDKDDLLSTTKETIQQVEAMTTSQKVDYFSNEVNGPSLYDHEFDLYSVSFPGFSAKFSKFMDGTFRTYPLSDTKIELKYNQYHTYWEITDTKGYKFIFGPTEQSDDYYATRDRVQTQSNILYLYNNFEENPPLLGSTPVSVFENSWYLTKIIDVAGKEIKIEYQKTSFINEGAPNEILTYGNVAGPRQKLARISTFYRSKEPQLKSIIFPEGKLDFALGIERKDILHDYDGYNEPLPKALDNIQLKSREGTLLKKINFKYSYFSPTGNIEHNQLGNTEINKEYLNYRLKLKEVDFTGSTTTSVEKYTLQYNELYNLPNRHSYATDLWGYYNGKLSNSSRIPTLINAGSSLDLSSTDFVSGCSSCSPKYIEGFNVNAGTVSFTGADKTVDENYTSANLLQKITYPTGAALEVSYESNEVPLAELYAYPTPSTPGTHGYKAYGLRVNGLQWKSNNTLLRKEKFYYDDNGISTGELFSFTNFYSIESVKYTQIAGNDIGAVMVNNFTPVPSNLLNASDGGFVGYNKIVKVVEGTTGNLKTEYHYLPRPFDVSELIRECITYPLDFKNWQRGLIKKEILFSSKNGSYIPIKELEYEYKFKSDDGEKMTTKGFVCMPMLSYNSTVGFFNKVVFKRDPYILTTERFWNSKKISREFDYDENNVLRNQVSIEEEFDYQNPQKNVVTSSSHTTSKGQTVKTEYKYPFDFVGTPVYSEMVNRNIISHPVEHIQTNVTANKLLSKSKTNYQFWQNNLFIKPENIQKSIAGNVLETETAINAYDARGNILQTTAKDGVITSFIWGYNSQYLVAKVVNASYNTCQSYFTQSVLDNAVGGSDDISLRIYLNILRNISGAFVTTYTYKPLIGITSEADPNNRTVYYEYDAFNRLSLVRDQDNNILKKICYNYKGQQENCGVTQTPQWQLTGNLRCAQNGNGQNTGYQEREEQDMNASSATYNTLRWVDNGYNTTACPLPTNCDYYSCTSTMGEQYACIYGQCEQGFRINTDSYYDYSTGLYACTYHYEFSDGSWSPNYTEYNGGYCPV